MCFLKRCEIKLNWIELNYRWGERDLVIMRNVIGVDWPDGTQTHEEIGLTVYGEPNGLSAMAQTVGYPVAIAAKMVLEGKYWHRLLKVWMYYSETCYKDHPRETRKVIFIGRWSLCTGFFSTCFNEKTFSRETK